MKIRVTVYDPLILDIFKCMLQNIFLKCYIIIHISVLEDVFFLST